MCNICSAHCTFVPPLVSTGIRKVYYRPRVLTAQVFTQYKHRRYILYKLQWGCMVTYAGCSPIVSTGSAVVRSVAHADNALKYHPAP